MKWQFQWYIGFFENIKANYRKSYLMALNAQKLTFLTTRELTLVSDEYIRVRERLKDFVLLMW